MKSLPSIGYDRVVSIEMFEHVGPKNHRVYMETVNKCLKQDGLFLIQFDGLILLQLLHYHIHDIPFFLIPLR